MSSTFLNEHVEFEVRRLVAPWSHCGEAASCKPLLVDFDYGARLYYAVAAMIIRQAERTLEVAAYSASTSRHPLGFPTMAIAIP